MFVNFIKKNIARIAEKLATKLRNSHGIPKFEIVYEFYQFSKK